MSLAGRIRRGISWTLAGTVASNIAKLATLTALGRLLEKHEFGIVAAAMTVIQFGNTIRDLGVGNALVQRKELSREHVESAFTFSLLLGLVIAGLTFVMAGPVAEFYEIPDAVWLIRVLGFMFVFRGLAVVPMFLCQREMNFRPIAIIDFASYVLGAGVSVVLAALDYGVWALAWGYVIETGVTFLMLSYVHPPRWGLRLHGASLRELLGFGTGLSIANIANYFANQGDYMVTGRYLGANELGIYQRAYELVRFPATVFTSVAGTVLFSAFAKVQDEPERLGRAYRRVMFACAIVLLPASAGLIVLAPEVIRILLGPGWDEVVWPFRIMALTMLFRTTYKVGGLVARATGDVFGIAMWQLVYATLVIGGAMLSKQWGVAGVATTTAIAVTVNFIGLTHLGIRHTTLGTSDLLAPIGVGLAVAIVVGGISLGVATGLRELDASIAVVVVVTTLTGGVAFLAILVQQLRRTTGDWPWLRETALTLVRRKKRPTERESADPML